MNKDLLLKSGRKKKVKRRQHCLKHLLSFNTSICLPLMRTRVDAELIYFVINFLHLIGNRFQNITSSKY